MSILFVGDTHFGHGNVIKYTNRPFAHAREMDEALVERWNSVVQPNDTVYHLGDVGLCAPGILGRILERLHGTIHLIRGNHDKAVLKAPLCERFASVTPLLELNIPDPDSVRGSRHIVLCHYKMAVWNKKHWGSWHLFGHSHGAIPDNPNEYSLDVGVDCWDYTPVSYERIKAQMATKTWTPPHRSREEDA